MIGQPFVDAAGGDVRKIDEQLGEVGLGIDFMASAGAGEAAQDGDELAAAGGGHEEGVLAQQSDAFHLLLSEVVVHGHGPVGDKQSEFLPLIQTAADGYRQRMLGQQRFLLQEKQFISRVQHRVRFRPAQGHAI